MQKYLYILCFISITSFLNAQNAKYCLDFDGTNDYINLGNNSSLVVQRLTIEAWIYADTWKTNVWSGTIVGKDDWVSGQRGYVLRAGASGTLELNMANAATGAWVSAISSAVMVTGRWYHVAGTYDGDSIRVYINGVLAGIGSDNSTVPGINPGTVNCLIGDCPGQLGSRDFDGKIDEVRIWKEALPDSVIREWMFKPITSAHPYDTNLVGYYHLNEGTGTSVTDASSKHNNGTMNGFATTAWVASYAPFASSPSQCLEKPAAIWPGTINSNSDIMAVTDTITGDAYVVIGHNNNALNYNFTDKPSNILKRISTFWRIEKEGSLNGTILFNYSGLDTSNFYIFKLLVDNDTSFYNASVISGVKKGNQIIAFYNISFQDSTFCTIGAFDYQAPSILTKHIDEVKAYTAKVTAQVTEDGGLITTRGVCWSTSPNPTIVLPTKTTNGNGNGTFQASITGLTPNTTYHVRAYASNSLGTSYGADSNFTTPVPAVPVVITSGRLNLFADSVYYKGNVTSDGNNPPVSERGFCWSTSPNPTTSSSKMIIGSGTGIFTGMIKGLSPSSTYHIRAYAINTSGTAYGADSTFTTLSISTPVVITGIISAIGGRSANVTGSISFDGRRPVTQKGFCWSTSPNPNTALTTVSNQGNGSASFNYTITGLLPNTIYHVRAYAINSLGTSYGGDSTFLTANYPAVILDKITSISYYSATINATVTDDGRQPVTSRGICWDTSANPNLKKSYLASGTGKGTYIIPLTSMKSNTLYHVRAYAINSVDTSYSADSTFKTLRTYPPTVVTLSPTNITAKSAKCNGNVIADGGASVTQRGFCWSTLPFPKASLPTKSVNGSGLGTYSFTIVAGLARGTTYHIRAFAVNSIDTAYGGDSVFTTVDIASVITDTVSIVNISTANCGGQVITDGGASVTTRGVCWNTKTNPTARLSTKTLNGSGLGYFPSVMSGLIAGTTYYVRAYAINMADTAYGNERTFIIPTPPVVTTTSVTSITYNSAKSGGTVISGMDITERGIVWSTNPNPTIALSTKTLDGTGTGSFTSTLTGLSHKTLYHVRAYAKNFLSVAYGNDISFTTADKIEVTTDSVIIKSANSAQCFGTVVSDGGNPVTSYGISWNTDSSNIKLLVKKTIDGMGTGSFSGNLAGLTPETLYYAAAYAINSKDTAFGVLLSFRITPAVVFTGTTTGITHNTAIVSGSVNARNIPTNCYFDYGLTTSYGSTINGSPSSFSDSILNQTNATLTGLSPDTIYHYRLVGESSHGKIYGTDSIFRTQKNSFIGEYSINKGVSVFINGNEIRVKMAKQNREMTELVVRDISGKEILHQKYHENEFSFLVPAAQSVYFLTITSDQETFSKKVIIH